MRQVSEASGVPRRSVQSIIDGHTPSLARAEALCEALGLELYIGPPRDDRDHGTGASVPGSRLQVAPTTARDLRRVLKAAAEVGVRAEEVARHLGPDEIMGLAPVVGRVAAGIPVEADQHVDGWVPFPAKWVAGNSNCFALQVAGDSMMLAGILDGDIAIVRRQETARSRQIVAATVEGETTLKRYLVEGDTRLLVAENVGYKPIDISAKGVVVHGRVVGLLRAYR